MFYRSLNEFFWKNPYQINWRLLVENSTTIPSVWHLCNKIWALPENFTLTLSYP